MQKEGVLIEVSLDLSKGIIITGKQLPKTDTGNLDTCTVQKMR